MAEKFETLIVDDDEGLSSNLQDILEAEGYGATVAHDGQTALTLYRQKAFDLGLIDIKLPDMSGIKLIEKLAELTPGMEHIIIITGYASLDSAIEAAGRREIVAYETKPLNMKHILALIRQLEERKRMEEKLRESDKRFHTCVETLLNGFAIFSAIRDEKGHIVDFRYDYINESGCQLNKRTYEGQIGHTLLELLPAHKDTGLFDEYVRVVETGQPLARESVLYEDVFGEGKRLSRAFDFRAVKLGDGFAVDWCDVTERRQAEETLKAQKELTDGVLASTPDAVLVIGKDLEIVLANKAFYETFGVKGGGAEGRQVSDVLPVGGLTEAISKVLANRKPQLNLEFRYKKVESDERILLAEITPMEEEVLLILHDVTGERATQEQLYHIGRLAAMGELASGIAHELNNPLSGVLGYSELVLAADIPEEVKRDVEVIHRNAQRAAIIVRNVLTFARRQKPEKQHFSVNDLVKQVLEMRSYELKVSNIEVITEFADELPEIMVDTQQLEQVFLNIILNAEQAMLEAHNRGTLTIKTETTRDMVRISFTDDGPGIPQENLSRVFDPFFTTREPGKGTGLGLSICHGIITGHGGKIYAESKIGEGTTFVVQLPM